jgi:membrane-associated phospholipid phosphatase
VTEAVPVRPDDGAWTASPTPSVSAEPAASRLGGVALGCLALCAAIGALVRSGTPWLDRVWHDQAVQHRSESVAALARTVTDTGSTAVVWPVIAVAALVFPRSGGVTRWVTAVAVAAAAGAAIGGRLLFSEVVQRARPPVPDWATAAGGYSYPSGHTNAATIGAGFLAWSLARHLTSRRARVAVWSLAVVWAGAVGLTRVVLGVHWPLDVAGGWLLGAGWLAGVGAVAVWARSRSTSPREAGEPA